MVRNDRGKNGTTSACAENTRSDRGGALFVGNYLRVRGEYALLPELFLLKSELPPRARRILGKDFLGDFFIGTTSACAENTLAYRTARTFIGNYLRVRGEYLLDDHGGVVVWELPPRARRIHSHGDHFDEILGTTSACAENTSST